MHQNNHTIRGKDLGQIWGEDTRILTWSTSFRTPKGKRVLISRIETSSLPKKFFGANWTIKCLFLTAGWYHSFGHFSSRKPVYLLHDVTCWSIGGDFLSKLTIGSRDFMVSMEHCSVLGILFRGDYFGIGTYFIEEAYPMISQIQFVRICWRLCKRGKWGPVRYRFLISSKSIFRFRRALIQCRHLPDGRINQAYFLAKCTELNR